MVVGRSSFETVLEFLRSKPYLGLDTETTGLRPYHGDRLFSIIIAHSVNEAFYFNFQPYEGLDPDLLLTPHHIARLNEVLFSRTDVTWFIANAKYDMSILRNEGVELLGEVHCTVTIGRIEYNEQMSFDLDSQLRRFRAPAQKDDGVKAWIEENKAWEYVSIEGRKDRIKVMFFDRVPMNIIVPYGLRDATGVLYVGLKQLESIAEQSEHAAKDNLPTVEQVMQNERKLLRTVSHMEREGVFIDKEYCVAAGDYERRRYEMALQAIADVAGEPYRDSWKFHAKLFESDRDKWKYGAPTKTGQVNPSFGSEVLATFGSPLAKHVLTYRDAKSKYQFYSGFLYHSDSQGRVHPNFNQHGANHGRFSSSEPNFQNLTSEDVLICLNCGKGHEEVVPRCEGCDSTELQSPPWLVRRAVIAPPGFFILSKDFKTMEYRFMLEQACRYMAAQAPYSTWIQQGIAKDELLKALSPLAVRVLDGEDYHQATSDLATGVIQTVRPDMVVKRGQAKTTNFLSLYGGGDAKLAAQLNIPLDLAKLIRRAIKNAAPEIDQAQRAMMSAAESRGYVRNWFGRRCYFPDIRFAYCAPNYLIAGGCADVVKIAMIRLNELLKPYKSRMVIQVHDEADFYIAFGEEFLIPRITRIMEDAYPAEYIPLTTSSSVSETSWADLREWKS